MKRLEWALIDPTGVRGVCPLICVYVPSVHGPSKVSNCYCSSNIVKWLLSFKRKQFIYVWSVMIGLILSITTDDMYSYHVPWILDLVSNDLDAGTLLYVPVASVDSPSV